MGNYYDKWLLLSELIKRTLCYKIHLYRIILLYCVVLNSKK